MTSLSRLVEAAPTWAEIRKQSKHKLRILVAPPQADGTPAKRSFDLQVEQAGDDQTLVRETARERKLPQCCVERHINEDGTFCLYLDSTKPITDGKEATEWWRGLQAFLSHQDFAEKRRFWPPNALSHGEAAADTQLKMEKISEPCGWNQEVLDGVFLDKGWLGLDLTRLTKTGDKAVNARGPCPRLCLSRHRPASRKDCSTKRCKSDCPKQHNPIIRADCPNRSSVEELILLEHTRREQEQAFLKYLKDKGVKCCGTMSRCPLR